MRPTKYIKSLALLAAASITALPAIAQDAAPAVAPAAAPSSSSDAYMYLLVGIAFILLIAIAVLGQVLIRLTLYVYENKSKLAKSLLLFLLLAGAGQSLMAQDAAAPAAMQVAKSASSSFSLEYIVALTVVLTEAFVIFVILIRIISLINVINPTTAAQKQMNFELPKWFDSINNSVAIEQEKDVMLDHDYDGIRELDNQLPPWWKWGFVLTIIWAFIYISYFHVFHAAPLSAGEYENEMADAKIAKDAYMKTAKNNVDENTIKFDPSYVADGQKIFSENCVACHGAKGEGGVGPNLTDNYWLHGGKINDIFKTVKYGWPANGMKSWQTDLSAMQIAQVVCYVKSLKGSNPPNPKAPQGDPYSEDGAAPKDSTATASAAKDSVGK
jgi:cytochrome c oxidase cbb3-type subunit 3